MKPKRISLRQRNKLKKMFPMTKEEIEKMQILKENIITSLVILILVVTAIAMILVLYLMINYKW